MGKWRNRIQFIFFPRHFISALVISVAFTFSSFTFKVIHDFFPPLHSHRPHQFYTLLSWNGECKKEGREEGIYSIFFANRTRTPPLPPVTRAFYFWSAFSSSRPPWLLLLLVVAKLQFCSRTVPLCSFRYIYIYVCVKLCKSFCSTPKDLWVKGIEWVSRLFFYFLHPYMTSI